ncbi:MAG: hypothetical protein ACXAD7_27755 [Candidatus Kariarchaeaceae archaeon]|jgi:hypothetical protein
MRIIDEINNFIHASEIRARFLQPRIFILPVMLSLIGFILSGSLDLVILFLLWLRYSFFIILFEWLVLYLIIILEKLQLIIQNQEKMLEQRNLNKERE